MSKLNQRVILTIALSASVISSSALADTNNRHYKNDYHRGNYKGEVTRKPVYKTSATRRRPVMEPIFLKDGPYVGLSAGYDSYKVDQNATFRGTNLSTTINPTINATGLVGGLLAGYGHYFNNALYLGGEVFLFDSAAYQSTNVTASDTAGDLLTYNTKFFVSTNYGVSVLPGVKLSDSGLVYFRLGYTVARLRGQENAYFNGGSVLQSNTSSWNGGFTYGLGFEQAMVENFSLRGDFAHTDYRSFTASSGTQFSASNNQFMVSLLYHLA